MVRALTERVIEALARLAILLLLQQQIAQLLVIAGRRIVENDRAERVDPPPPREPAHGVPHQTEVGKHLDEEIDERTRTAEEDDDPEPKRLRPPPYEVDDGDQLQDDAPRIEESSHRDGANYSFACMLAKLGARPSRLFRARGVYLSALPGRSRMEQAMTAAQMRAGGQPLRLAIEELSKLRAISRARSRSEGLCPSVHRSQWNQPTR